MASVVSPWTRSGVMSIEGRFTQEEALEKVMNFFEFQPKCCGIVSARAGHTRQKGTS